MTSLLKATLINKSFRNERNQVDVLKEVSLTINEGEFVAIMGPSGCGKTTLLYVLSGMDSVNQGDISFAGKKLSKQSETSLADIRRKEMGFVFQQPTFLKNLAIIDNIILSTMRDRHKQVKRVTEEAMQLMKSTGIQSLAKRMPSQVSGGQLQRAGICRALINKPKLILADEPTGALNSKAAAEIMDIFKRINHRGTTILLVTHDAKVAAQSDRVLYMKDGKIVEELLLASNDLSVEQKMESISEMALLTEE